MPFDPSQLFRRADVVLRRELEESFARTPVGMVTRLARRQPGQDPARLMEQLGRGLGLRELQGTTIA
jgi:hypothetical protein